MNAEYAKAYLKRGDIKLEMELFDESIAEYSKVSVLNWLGLSSGREKDKLGSRWSSERSVRGNTARSY